MFSHGNGEVIDFWPEEFEEPRRWGMGVLLVEYCRIRAAPTARRPKKSITEGMLAAYDWARQHKRHDAVAHHSYGRSLGGGAAAILAVERPVPALILESTFS